MKSNWSLILLAAVVAAGGLGVVSAAPLPKRVVVHAEQSGWSFTSADLTLTLSNGVYSSGTLTVPATVVSNLMNAALRPWPSPASNAWPRFIIDLENLGLTTNWLQANYPRLLASYFADPEQGPFPNTSAPQRAWLTNALGNLDLIGEALRRRMTAFWTCDYPELELTLEDNPGGPKEKKLHLKTTAQPAFMLPWEVQYRGKHQVSANAEISRAVVRLLPPGFQHRQRLDGDLFEMVRVAFLDSQEVHQYLTKSVLDHTLGTDAGPTPLGFELQHASVLGGDHTNFPATFYASVHRTNWPERVTMPVEMPVHRGVVTNLKAVLGTIDARVAPLLTNAWMLSRLANSNKISLEIKQGSPVHPWLGGHMREAGLGIFYDQVWPDLQRSIGFLLREDPDRASYWAILGDGRLLLYGFTGNGVLGWKPEELGFRGDGRPLNSAFIHHVAVFVDPQGALAQVFTPLERSAAEQGR